MHAATFVAAVSTMGLACPALAASQPPPWVGDPHNGAKLFEKHCSACHGKAGEGGRSGVALDKAERINTIRDGDLFKMVQLGRNLKRSKEHTFDGKLSFLETWDVIAHVHQLHMTLAEFFPEASRYLSKNYTVDKYGLERIKEATGKSLKDKSAVVLTFFQFEGEEGKLTFVPQDPILLDQLKKKNKVGYLVFLPLEVEGFSGELGVAMDAKGVMTRLAVHPNASGAAELNPKLEKFVGMGKKGQSVAFKAPEKALAPLTTPIFEIYMRAMETVTMFDREERERTWADE